MFAQESVDYNPYENNSNEYKESFNPEKIKKMDCSIEFGTGFESYLKNGSNFYNYVMPTMRYKLNPRVSIRAGIMMMNMNLNNINYRSSEGIKTADGNFIQNYFYTVIDYNATDKLRITGEIMYGSGTFGKTTNKLNTPKSYTVGATYKINDFMEIGVKFRQTENVNSYMPNNYYNNSMYGF